MEANQSDLKKEEICQEVHHVESNEPVEKPYVTVVSVEGESEGAEEEVLVYRLPGERLGFGLKFDGGIRNVDKVSRLFIQSCAGDSPASRTQASWGPLGPGDEIVSIDGVRVDSMTRTDCVRALKESAVVIKLVVRKRSDPSLPPPIPPRKCLRRRQSDSQVVQTVQQPEPLTKTRSSGIAQAEVYTDLFSNETTVPAESESDDTSSSLSTVVSRVSSTANSSFSDARSINSIDISPPTTVKSTTPFDLDKVLEPFLQLERELSSSTLDSGSLFTRLVEASTLLDPATGGTNSSGGPDLPPRPVPRLSTTANTESSSSPQPSSASTDTQTCPPPPPRTDVPRPPCPPRPPHHVNLLGPSSTQPPHPPPPPPPPPPQQHLPRLIDFVPKDRTDVLVPSPIHPPDKTVGEEATNSKEENASTTKTEKAVPQGRMERGRISGGCHTVGGGVGGGIGGGTDYQLRAPPDGHELAVEDISLHQPYQRTRTRSGSCNDERSERSVRDKIAMFSEQSATSTSVSFPINGRKMLPHETSRPNKAPPSPPQKRDRNIIPTPKVNDQRKLKNTLDLRIPENTTNQSQETSSVLPRTERNLVPTLTRAVSFTGGTKLHSRSQSLVDIGSRAALKADESKRLSSMIEQRRRCMSKLRGLVIPEKVAEVPHFVDLPEIKSRDCPLPFSPSEKQQIQPANVECTSTSGPSSASKLPPPLIPSPPWKSVDASLPKYSPAFKRKSLTLYGAQNGTVSSWLGSSPVIADQASDQYLDLVPSRLSMKSRIPTPPINTKGTESRDEESDNDSAVSSSRSDLSHSPTNELTRLSVTRTLSDETNASTESTITLGSLTSQGTQPNVIPTHASGEHNPTVSLNKDNAKMINENHKDQDSSLVEPHRLRRSSITDELSDVAKNQEKKIIHNSCSDPPPRLTSGLESQPSALNDHNKVKPAKHPLPLYKNNNYNCHNNNIPNNGIKKHFDKSDGQVKIGGNIQHPRVSSIDSTTSDDCPFPTTSMYYGSVTNLQREQQFGSITSLASSTSLISQQELSQLIEEANHTLEESHEVVVVILHRDNPGGSIGITLAGGADYEAKEITVHKVLVGSPAERDGRIQKGDRILSINGKSMKGLTHYESLAILKAPRPEVVLVVSRHKTDSQEENSPLRCHTNTIRSPRFIEPPKHSSPPTDKENEVKWGPVETVVLHKDGTGLGFSLKGGKDSPYGDMPLTIKKIFTGGCAEKCGLVFAGDELLSVNGLDVSGLSRIEAWALMKRLPDGRVTLTIRHPLSTTTP